MSALTRDDLSVIEGDARVSCRRLSEVLGFARHDVLIRLVKAKLEELQDFGPIFHFEAEKSGPGRRRRTYLFNEHQAVALCMWANTARAREARMQIVEVFVAWRRGDLHGLAVQAQGPDAFEAGAQRAEVTLRHLRSLTAEDWAVLPFLLRHPRAVFLDESTGNLVYLLQGADGRPQLAVRMDYFRKGAKHGERMTNMVVSGYYVSSDAILGRARGGKLSLLTGSLPEE